MLTIKETEPRRIIPAIKHIEMEYDDVVEMIRRYMQKSGIDINDEEIIIGGLDMSHVRNGGKFWLDIYIEENIDSTDFKKTQNL